jgi:hypothetical protein
MATWIAHLRIAETLLKQISDFDIVSFVHGSIAPDCGLPNEDWTEFTPPKQVTHYYHKTGELRDLCFYREYLVNHSVTEDIKRISFLWGYFLHLVTDALWYTRLAITTREEHPGLFVEKGDQAWWVVKEDWYDLDHRFLRDHPDSLFWKVFICQPDPPQYLPFLPVEGIKIQFAHIREYYSTAHVEKGLDRPFPYLNETTMQTFIHETTASLEKIYTTLQRPLAKGVGDMSQELMLPEDCAPLNPPLGDPMPV